MADLTLPFTNMKSLVVSNFWESSIWVVKCCLWAASSLATSASTTSSWASTFSTFPYNASFSTTTLLTPPLPKTIFMVSSNFVSSPNQIWKIWIEREQVAWVLHIIRPLRNYGNSILEPENSIGRPPKLKWTLGPLPWNWMFLHPNYTQIVVQPCHGKHLNLIDKKKITIPTLQKRSFGLPYIPPCESFWRTWNGVSLDHKWMPPSRILNESAWGSNGESLGKVYYASWRIPCPWSSFQANGTMVTPYEA